MGEIFRGNAALTWVDSDDLNTERVLLLREPLREWRPAHTQAAYRAVSLDQTVIQVFTVGVGVDELIGRIRFSDQPQTLLDLIKAGTKLRTINYFPDLDDTSRTVACYLVSPLSPTQLNLDSETGSKFLEQEVEVRFRRTTNAAFTTDVTMQGILFSYTAGGSLSLGTFTRATAATYRDKFGVGQSAASGKPRIAWTGAQPRLALEAARTQLVTDPENIGLWTQWPGGTALRTSGQSDSFGGTAAYLIEDDDAVNLEGWYEAVTFPAGTADRAMGLFLRADTAAISAFGIWDNTAATWRHLVRATWAAGAPTLSSAQGSGTRFIPEPWGGGWYWLSVSAIGVVGANVNRLAIFPAGDVAAATGRVYAFGANAWNATFPSSYQGPTLATRNADSLTFPYLAKPQAQWIYVKFIELGTAIEGSADGLRVFAMGSSSVGNLTQCWIQAVSGKYAFKHLNASATTATSLLATGPSYGDTVELLALLYADGSVQLKQSLNGLAETSATQSVANTLPAIWGATTLYLNQQASGVTGFAGFQKLLIGQGTTINTVAAARQARG